MSLEAFNRCLPEVAISSARSDPDPGATGAGRSCPGDAANEQIQVHRAKPAARLTTSNCDR